MHLKFNNCNDAFRGLVSVFQNRALPMVNTNSRVGEVLQITEPVVITYSFPLQRVLFNESRDQNPFFALMEALWMLAGRGDIAPMAYYAANYRECVQDGDNPNANGAYGYRWRSVDWPHDYDIDSKDQLPIIIDQLKRKPESRRVVLQMWNVVDDLLNIDSTKDVCCNTHAYFLINGGKLDMTVCNRSNDLVWGALGANVVHFSFLQEYLAANIGVPVGVYHQVTNNLHVYTSRFYPDAWLGDTTPDYYNQLPRLNGIGLVASSSQFETELQEFNADWLGVDLGNKLHLPGSDVFRESFLANVAYPAALAFYQHKKREYKIALEWATQIVADDWRLVCVNWLRRRQASYERAKDDGVSYTSEGDNRNPYLVNELQRLKGVPDASSIPKEE